MRPTDVARPETFWVMAIAAILLYAIACLVLTVVGLFSVVAYTVDSRMNEFGVRMALGAQPANLYRLVMKRGVSAAAVGVAVGIAGALALTRFMQSLLFDPASTTSFRPGSVCSGAAGSTP